MSLYRILASVFLGIVGLAVLLVGINHLDGRIYWTVRRVVLFGTSVLFWLSVAAFWRWADDMLKAVRD